MSAKKPARRKPPSKSRLRFKGGSAFKVLAAIVILILLGVGYLVLKNYHEEGVRQRVEEVVGELDPQGVSLRVGDLQGAQAMMDRLRGVEEGSWGAFRLGKLKAEKNAIRVEATLDNEKYNIEFYWEQVKVPAPPAPKRKPEPAPRKKVEAPGKEQPRLALVIDDLGASTEVIKEFLALPFPITPAIIPHLAHSTEAASLAAGLSRPYLLHMPMEPSNYPKNNPGEGALMKKDSPEKVRQSLERAFASVPGASGMNNHMGSKATAALGVMEPVMEEIARRNMFFLDSMTTADSVATKAARNAGVPWAIRDVFLDNDNNVPAIERQIALAVAEARKKGHAVAIGHGYPATLQALRNSAQRFIDEGVKIVPVSELIQKGNT